MAERVPPESPQPISSEVIDLWRRKLTPEYLHKEGWSEINKRYHPVALHGRHFALQHLQADPQRRTDFLDGLTFGLLALAHSSDIDHLLHLFYDSQSEAEIIASGGPDAGASESLPAA